MHSGMHNHCTNSGVFKAPSTYPTDPFMPRWTHYLWKSSTGPLDCATASSIVDSNNLRTIRQILPYTSAQNYKDTAARFSRSCTAAHDAVRCHCGSGSLRTRSHSCLNRAQYQILHWSLSQYGHLTATTIWSAKMLRSACGMLRDGSLGVNSSWRKPPCREFLNTQGKRLEKVPVTWMWTIRKPIRKTGRSSWIWSDQQWAIYFWKGILEWKRASLMLFWKLQQSNNNYILKLFSLFPFYYCSCACKV